MNQSAAYRSAYDCKKWKDTSIWEHASRLACNGKVQARISELREELVKKQLWTREYAVKILKKITASEGSKPTEVIAAVKELNVMHGFNLPPEKADGSESLVEALKDLADRLPV